jgi:hypothetical protein
MQTSHGEAWTSVQHPMAQEKSPAIAGLWGRAGRGGYTQPVGFGVPA